MTMATIDEIELMGTEKRTNDAGRVRVAVAYNENTPASILEQLANDDYRDVRLAVAGNSNTPVATLEKLADDGNETVRIIVASS